MAQKDTLTRKLAESGSGLDLTGSITYPAEMHKDVEPLAAKFKQLFAWCLSWGTQESLELSVTPTVVASGAMVRIDKPGKATAEVQFTTTAKLSPEQQATLFAAMDSGAKCDVIVRVPDKKGA